MPHKYTGVQRCNQTKVEPQPACIYPTNPRQKPQDIYTQYSAIDVSPKGLARRWHVHKNLQI